MRQFIIGSAVVAVFVTLLFNEGGTVTAQKGDEPKKTKVTGTIEYKGEAKFESGTIARVTLQDVSLADASADKIGEHVIKDLKKFPIVFEVEYDPTAIKKGRTYAIGVRIETDGRLDYINDTRIEVLSNNKPSKEVKAFVVSIRK